jgi:hypothetical protein
LELVTNVTDSYNDGEVEVGVGIGIGRQRLDHGCKAWLGASNDAKHGRDAVFGQSSLGDEQPQVQKQGARNGRRESIRPHENPPPQSIDGATSGACQKHLGFSFAPEYIRVFLFLSICAL